MAWPRPAPRAQLHLGPADTASRGSAASLSPVRGTFWSRGHVRGLPQHLHVALSLWGVPGWRADRGESPGWCVRGLAPLASREAHGAPWEPPGEAAGEDPPPSNGSCVSLGSERRRCRLSTKPPARRGTCGLRGPTLRAGGQVQGAAPTRSPLPPSPGTPAALTLRPRPRRTTERSEGSRRCLCFGVRVPVPVKPTRRSAGLGTARPRAEEHSCSPFHAGWGRDSRFGTRRHAGASGAGAVSDRGCRPRVQGELRIMTSAQPREPA